MFDDNYLRKRAEELRVSAGDSYRKAARYDGQGKDALAAEERRSAEWSTRKAEVYERSVGRRWDAMAMAWITSANVDVALKLLDRIDRASAEEVFSGAGLDEHAAYCFEDLQGRACAWAMANELREGAVSGVVEEVLRAEERGAEVNIAALARMTGISRQTLHARLNAARASR
ncbi:hypothetical protein [Streptomyces sp. NPDC127112]|uniref:hypothetical protein n=1 Tax=Streptomyces sp. NPDC127112 TaxID=3345364 RepID=UPI00362FC245